MGMCKKCEETMETLKSKLDIAIHALEKLKNRGCHMDLNPTNGHYWEYNRWVRYITHADETITNIAKDALKEIDEFEMP